MNGGNIKVYASMINKKNSKCTKNKIKTTVYNKKNNKQKINKTTTNEQQNQHEKETNDKKNNNNHISTIIIINPKTRIQLKLTTIRIINKILKVIIS